MDIITITFGAVNKLKENKGFLVYEGNSVKDAYKKARGFIQKLGLETHITKDGKWITTQIELDENTSIIDFGSHTLFFMRKVKHINDNKQTSSRIDKY